MVKIFVSIINFNGEEDTLNCLDCLDGIKVSGFNLNAVVIDNGSDKIFKTEKKYKNFDFKILRSEKNLGFSGGQNLGIKYSLENSADFVLILNNDVLIDENLITNLLKTFEKEKDTGVVSPKIYFSSGHEFHKDRYKKHELGKVFWYAGGIMDLKNIIGSHRGVDEVDKGQFDTVSKTDFASGCCMLVKKEVFEKVGLFNEDYFLYYEDTDFCFRAKNKGYGIYYEPSAVLWHHNAGSAGGSGSKLQDYYITRNRLIFASKFAGLRAKNALVRESFKTIIKGSKWQKKGAIDFYFGKFGKGSFINE